jgi:hypothetical protein
MNERSLSPTMTVEQAGPVLEREFRIRFGAEYDRLSRTLALQIEENTRDAEDQVLAMATIIGQSLLAQPPDRTILYLALVWLSKKQSRDPLAAWMLEELRQRPIGEFLTDARQAIQRAQEEGDRKERGHGI